jgi:hypothetical protein
MSSIKEGPLIRKEKGGLRWNERHFVLTTTNLEYYGTAGGSCMGDWDLTRSTKVESVDTGIPDNVNAAFSLTSGKVTLVVGTADEETAKEWVTAIKSVLAYTVLSGTLFKRGEGGTMKRANWKERYFMLDKTKLAWYTEEGGELKGDMALAGHVMMELVPDDLKKTGNSASSAWRFAITSDSRRLVMAAESEEEMHRWVAGVQTVVGGNLILEGKLDKGKLNDALRDIGTSIQSAKLADEHTSADKDRLRPTTSAFEGENKMAKPDAAVGAKPPMPSRASKPPTPLALSKPMGEKGKQENENAVEEQGEVAKAAKAAKAVKAAKAAKAEEPSPSSSPSASPQQIRLDESGEPERVWVPDHVYAWALRDVVAKGMNGDIEVSSEYSAVHGEAGHGEAGEAGRGARTAHGRTLQKIRTADEAKERALKKSQRKHYKQHEVHRLDPSHLLDLDDVASMDNLHPAPLLALMKRRYASDKIYTNVGEVLVSVNPYKNVEAMYTMPSKPELRRRAKECMVDVSTIAIQEEGEEEGREEGGSGQSADGPKERVKLAPHVFSAAEQAYSAMLRCIADKSNVNQSVLVSGESGAGKTEACKHMIRYFAQSSQAVAEADAMEASPAPAPGGGPRPSTVRSLAKAGSTASHVEDHILQTSPLLEAFGNSVTLRNNNSSRFGRLLRIAYSERGTMIGANTQTFLLERIRVVAHREGERAYHIFYQVSTTSVGSSRWIYPFGRGAYPLDPSVALCTTSSNEISSADVRGAGSRWAEGARAGGG